MPFAYADLITKRAERLRRAHHEEVSRLSEALDRKLLTGTGVSALLEGEISDELYTSLNVLYQPLGWIITRVFHPDDYYPGKWYIRIGPWDDRIGEE